MDYCCVSYRNQYTGTETQDVLCERKVSVLGVGRFGIFSIPLRVAGTIEKIMYCFSGLNFQICNLELTVSEPTVSL